MSKQVIDFDPHIQSEFDCVMRYSQEGLSGQIHSEKIFQEWAKNKYPLWKAMGKKLIYEYPHPVSFALNKEKKEEIRLAFMESLYDIDVEAFRFFSAEQEGFFENKMPKDFALNNGQVIKAGAKINKMFGRYWKDRIPDSSLTNLQNSYSRCIQLDKITGQLCLSIHPLDFLSASENTHDWRSCHALDGEYRMGNISYMMDEPTIMVYLKSDEPTKLPHFPLGVPWNNKKWRCFLFFDRQRRYFYAGRQYPFFSEEALDCVLDCLLEPLNCLMDNSLNSYPVGYHTWRHNCTNEVILHPGEDGISLASPHIVQNGVCAPLRNYIKDENRALHYNDLLNSTVYTPWTLSLDNYSFVDHRHSEPLIIGKAVPCLKCGEVSMYDSDAPFCAECALESGIDREWISTCSCCGERMLVEEEVWTRGDLCMCPTCAQDNIHYCDRCGEEIVANEDVIYWMGPDANIPLCASCHEMIEESREDDY